MNRLLVLLAAGCLVSFVGSAAVAEEPLKVGDTAPDFELTASDGKTYKLSDLTENDVVVVAWFPRAFTGGCTKECISFRENGAKLKDYQVSYFTASTDPVKKNAEFAKSLSLDYPILSDPNGAVAIAYGIYNADRNAANRTTFVIGKERKILHIDRSVKTTSHGEDIAGVLSKLGVEKR